MSGTIRLQYVDYPLRNFERKLARLELDGLGVRVVKRSTGHCLIDPAGVPVDRLVERLAFFHEVQLSDRKMRTLQRDLDVSASVARTLAFPTMSVEDALDGFANARNGHRAVVHSYVTHGLHQYKGKYYPQIVRALLNHFDVRPGQVVLDPFVGSGTTTLEASLSSIASVGIDLNPLAAFVARTKVESLGIEPDRLTNLLANAKKQLANANPSRISLPNDEYLGRWFDPATKRRLTTLLSVIGQATSQEDEVNLCMTVLSNCVLSWSMQMPGQLRVRRRKSPPDTRQMFDDFRGRLERAAATIFVYSALHQRNKLDPASARIYNADARVLSRLDEPLLAADGVDAVITSPPYATALPYLDTDRLSLYLLDLMSPRERRRTDERMIGNREIAERRRRELEDELAAESELPPPVHRFLIDVLETNRKNNVGFRRRNAAALLYQYFADMRRVFSESLTVLKPGGRMAVVVGNSHTLLGGKEDLEIPTDRFLELVGRSTGFESELRLPMTDQASYMAHSRNGIKRETIFVLRKPSAQT